MAALDIVILALLTVAITVPFGAYRSTVRRLSAQWFLAIHLPVPLILLLRLASGHTSRIIPLLVVAAVVGQLLGSWAYTRLRAARGGAPAVVPVPPDDGPTDSY
jgi:hypothetical protein